MDTTSGFFLILICIVGQRSGFPIEQKPSFIPIVKPTAKFR